MQRALSPSLRRLALATLILALPFGCEKAGGGTQDPGGGGSKQPSKAAGLEFAYAESFVLDGQISVETTQDGSDGKGTGKVVAKTHIEATPEKGKTRVHGKVVELLEFAGTGALDPEFLNQQLAKVSKSETPIDLRALVGSTEAWTIVDNHNETDEAATKALSENAVVEGKLQLGDQFGLLQLPALPTIPLEIGKPVELPTEAKDVSMGGLTMPTETDITWKLVSVSEAGGRKLATLELKVEGSGAVEIDGGQGMLSIGEESTYVIVFDVDAKIPVSLTADKAEEFAFDHPQQSGSQSSISKISATYGPV